MQSKIRQQHVHSGHQSPSCSHYTGNQALLADRVLTPAPQAPSADALLERYYPRFSATHTLFLPTPLTPKTFAKTPASRPLANGPKLARELERVETDLSNVEM